PSSSLSPRVHDRSVTEKIRAAGNLLDIVLHDHLLIGGDGYYSFVDEGILSERQYVK
ncbi:MAG: hypothetical protein K2I47_01485, partial [Odoribacter sp.]|nr:hypothetical protein [Odoribacter sp.]